VVSDSFLNGLKEISTFVAPDFLATENHLDA
jgi:hypothetical protein